jgi:hypothetical protein
MSDAVLSAELVPFPLAGSLLSLRANREKLIAKNIFLFDLGRDDGTELRPFSGRC